MLAAAFCAGGAGGAGNPPSTIAVERERPGGGIALYDAAGRKLRTLAERGHHFSWSPNGKRFAFTTETKQATLVHIRAMDQPGEKVISLNTIVVDLDWSPDGTRLLYTGDGLHTIDIASGDTSVISIRPEFSEHAAWSPDGRSIITNSSLDGVFLVRSDGSAVRKLSDHGYDEGHTWSPDGRWIAYTHSARPGLQPRRVYVVRPDGSGVHPVTDGFDDRDPSWSSDGKLIAFDRNPLHPRKVPKAARSPRIFVVDPSAGTARPLPGVTGHNPDWRPTAARVLSPSPVAAGARVSVPKVAGLFLREARAKLEAVGLAVAPIQVRWNQFARLLVTRQVPQAGTKVAHGYQVQLAVADVAPPFSGVRFDPAIWRRYRRPCDHANPRRRMYADVTGRIIKKGMPVADVLRLLGGADSSVSKDLDYQLGVVESRDYESAGCWYLHLEIDNGKVAKISRRRIG